MAWNFELVAGPFMGRTGGLAWDGMAKIGVDVIGTSAADYAKFLANDYAKWAKVTKAAGIEPQ